MILFRLIDQQGKEFVGRCTEMLPNKMQCYSGADYEISASDNSINPRQVCRFHAKLIDAEQKKAEPSIQLEPTKPPEDTVDVNTSESIPATPSKSGN